MSVRPEAPLVDEFLADFVSYALAHKPSEDEASWDSTLVQADVAALALLERHPDHPLARTWRAARREQANKTRAKLFRMCRTPDERFNVIKQIGGSK